MALSVRPQFRQWDRVGHALSTVEAQFGFGRAIDENMISGFLSSYGAGTVARELMTPQPNVVPDPNAPLLAIPNPIEALAKAAGAWGALARGDKPEPTMTEEEFRASPDWREAIPYEPGMTKSRLAAVSAMYDVNQARAMMSQKEWGGALIGQFMGQALDPINYAPFLGEAVQTAAVVRLGSVLGRVSTAALDAAVNTAVFGIATAEMRRRFGDAVTFEAMAQEIAMSAVIGGVFGLGVGVLSIPGELSSAAAVKAAAARMASLRDVQGRMAILSDSTDRLARGEEMNPMARVEFERQVAKFQAEVSRQEEFDIARAVEARTAPERAQLETLRAEIESTPVDSPRRVELAQQRVEIEERIRRADVAYRAQRELVARGVSADGAEPTVRDLPPPEEGMVRIYTQADPQGAVGVAATVEPPAGGTGWYADVPAERVAEVTGRQVEPATGDAAAAPNVQPITWQSLPKPELPPTTPFRRLMINRFMEGGRSGEEGLALAKTFEAAYANLSSRAGWTPEKMLQEYPLPEVIYGGGATDGQPLNQTATIRRGKETLKKYGLDPAKKHTTRKVAAALEARQRKKYGTIERSDFSPEASTRIANWMVEEVMFEVEQAEINPARSAVGWYSSKFQRALDSLSEAFPEFTGAMDTSLPGVALLGTQQNARDFFTALMAITSDGAKVADNFRFASRSYEAFRQTGKIDADVTFGGERNKSMRINLANIQKVLDQHGPDGMAKFLLQKDTISNLKKIAKEQGAEFSSAYKASMELPYSALVFGPKLGAFYANLMGDTGYLTMDRWWSRTFNRYRGTLLQKPTEAGLARFKQLVTIDQRLNEPASMMTDDQALALTVDYVKSYKEKGFKEGTEIEKAANTLWKAAFEGLEDQPFNASDREFMISTTVKAQKALSRRGVKLTIADIQAVLWYYEKRLYGELGARQTQDISYEEIAKNVVAGRDPAGGSDDGVAGEAGDEGSLDEYAAGEDDYGPALDAPDEVFNQGPVDRGVEIPDAAFIKDLQPIVDAADAALKGDAATAVDEFIGHTAGARDRVANDWTASMGIMRGQALEAAARGDAPGVAQALEEAFSPVREKIRGMVGNVVRLYRVQMPVEVDPKQSKGSVPQDGRRAALSWTSNRKFARQYAGATKDVPVRTEEQVLAAEAEFAASGRVKIGRYWLVDEGTGYPGIFPDRDGEPAMDDMVTDTDSVRSYIEGENEWAREVNARNAEKLATIVSADVPIDELVWVTDRAGQAEFIVRNGPDRAIYIDEAGKLQKGGTAGSPVPTSGSNPSLGEIGEGATFNQAAVEAAARRYVGGLSIQQSAGTQGRDFVPGDADMAALQSRIEARIGAGGEVRAAKALSTEGRYGDIERSVDLEVRADANYDPTPLWKHMVSEAALAKQDSVFLAREIEALDEIDPTRHTPGVELLFNGPVARADLDARLEELKQQGVEFLTVMVDGKPSTPGAMPDAIGIRMLYMPEFERRYGFADEDLAGMSEDELGAYVMRRADAMDDQVREVVAKMPGMTGRVAWFDTNTAFGADYGRIIGDGADVQPTGGSEAAAGAAGGEVWAGRPVRERLAAADRHLAYAAQREAGDGGGDAGRASDQLIFEQPAYHGSPHIFDRFEWSDKTRGAGEGAQAFGDGLYFASKKEVAEQVRDDASTWQRDDAASTETPRGQIRFKDGRSLVTLFDGADPSTALHEAGHHFLMMIKDMAERTDTAPGIKEDWGAVKGWLAVNAKDVASEAGNGVTADDVLAVLSRNTSGDRMKDIAINRGIHEQWARGFEAYFLEGKAPSAGMRGVFESFKKWLAAIYASVKSLNVNLTPEIRQVFDRLLTDEATPERAVVTAATGRARAPTLDPPPPAPVDPALPRAAAAVGKSEDVAGFEEQVGARVDGTYNEEGDIEMLRSLGRILPEEEAALKAADDGYKDSVAFEKAIKVALACVMP